MTNEKPLTYRQARAKFRLGNSGDPRVLNVLFGTPLPAPAVRPEVPLARLDVAGHAAYWAPVSLESNTAGNENAYAINVEGVTYRVLARTVRLTPRRNPSQSVFVEVPNGLVVSIDRTLRRDGVVRVSVIAFLGSRTRDRHEYRNRIGC